MNTMGYIQQSRGIASEQVMVHGRTFVQLSDVKEQAMEKPKKWSKEETPV